MQDQTFEQMLNDSMKEIRTGEIITGKVISVSPDKIALNIGYKADGIVTRENYSNDYNLDLTTVVNVGDEIEVKVKRLNDGEGQVVLSHRDLIDSFVKKELKALYDKGEIITGKVIKVTSGGLIVEVKPLVNVFMPKSLISNVNENDIDKYLNEELEFYITEYNPIKKRAIADRKRILVAKEKEKRMEALSKLHEGDIVNGIVKKVLDYGVFVNLSDIDGFLHITEMSWGKIQSPKKTHKEGDTIRVMIKSIKDNKIDLTAKIPDEDPWISAREEFGIGKTVKGKVARITEYGAFIELNPYIDGLLHISQISKEKVKKVDDILKIGDEIEVKVIDFNEKDKRISLSMKALLPDDEVVDDNDDSVVDVNIEEYVANMGNQDSENTDD